MGHGFMNQGGCLHNKLAVFQNRVSGHGANPQPAGFILAYSIQFRHIVQINEDRGLRQAKIHDRDEALSTSQKLTIITMLVHQAKRFA